MRNIIRQKRKGISSVVGAVFMILVMVGALNVMIWTMQQQDRVTETIIEKSNSNLNKLNEDIDISNIRIDSDKLNMTVTNAGGAAATIKSIYIVNETANEQYRYDLDLVVDGRESLNIDGQDVPLIIKDDNRYSVRLITESGNTVTTSLMPLSSVALPMSIYVIPPTVRPGDNVTILLAVTNNLTDSALAVDITPTLDVDPGCAPGPSCLLTEHVAPSGVSLTEGNTRLFKWVYEVDVPDETYITFNASLAGAKEGNYAIEEAYAKLIEESQISSSTTQVIYTSLVQRPEIFLILPSPFGESSAKALIGVVVANPTQATMEVSRIVINMYSSKATGAGTIAMIDPNDCDFNTDFIPIYPSTASEWTCPHANMIEWKDVVNRETIGELEAKSFMVRMTPGSLGDPEPAFTVTVSVFTNMGQFTKTGYASGMHNSAMSLGNVYMTDTTTPEDAVDNDHIFGHKLNIQSGQPIMLNVTMADLDTLTTTKIESGSKLIVNVPTGFTDVTLESWEGFVDDPVINEFEENNSWQIVGILNEDLGDASTEAKILSFTATAPVETQKKIFVMYTLIDGETSTDFSAGALAELVLQVVP